MKGWLKTTLGNHVDIITGYPFKSELYTEAEKSIRLLRGDNIIPGSTRWDGVKYWSLDKVEGLNKYYLNPQDLIIAMDRVLVSNGLKITIIKDEDVPALLVQRVARLRGNKGLDQKFLPYLVMSYKFEQYVKSVQTETAIPHISTQQINDFPIFLPPLSEQCKIAEVLGAWDEAIDLLEKLVASNRSRKQGLMQQLLTGKKRFKEFEGSEWKSYSFSEIVKLRSKKFDPKTSSESKMCVELEHISQTSGKLIGTVDSSKQASTKNHFFTGDVLFGKLRPYLRKYLLAQFDGVCSTEIWVLVSQKYIASNYLFYLVQTSEFIATANVSSGSKMPRADWGYISEVSFRIPPLPEQEKIAAVLTAADEEIATLEKQLAAYKRQKIGLMQQLLTGRIRI
jgi:type I restriction enzyme, S subunit